MMQVCNAYTGADLLVPRVMEISVGDPVIARTIQVLCEMNFVLVKMHLHKTCIVACLGSPQMTFLSIAWLRHSECSTVCGIVCPSFSARGMHAEQDLELRLKMHLSFQTMSLDCSLGPRRRCTQAPLTAGARLLPKRAWALSSRALAQTSCVVPVAPLSWCCTMRSRRSSLFKHPIRPHQV